MGSDSHQIMYWMIVDLDKFGYRRTISPFMKGKCVSSPSPSVGEDRRTGACVEVSSSLVDA